MTLPLCVWTGISDADSSSNLQGFCNYSMHACTAVVYLVIKTPTEQFVRFIASKTRVAPLKSQTIPRLELLSALLLARLVTSVAASLETELTLDPPTCYTDSKVALFWILGVSRVWKQFVQRRVTEVRKLLPCSLWHHCPGVDNPADLPSRGLSPMELACSKLWVNGPSWLGRPVTKETAQDMPMPGDCVAELRVPDKPVTLGLLITDARLDIDCQRYSSLQKLLRVTARVLMFLNNLKNKVKAKIATFSEPTAMSEVELLAQAEKL